MEGFSPIDRMGLGPLTILLVGTGLGLGLLAYLTRRGRMFEALRLTFSQPAFLVPAAMVTAALVLLMQRGSAFDTLHENPFGAYLAQRYGRALRINWVALLLVAAGLAGQIGLLRAHAAGRAVGSRAFADGVVDHVLTIALGKLAIAGLLYWISMLQPQTLGWVLVLVPSVLLAPLLGTTARHPRDPAAAFAACLSISSRTVAGVGRVVTAQALFLFGVFRLYDLCGHSLELMPSLLGFSSSALSYNHFPLLLLFHGGLLDYVAIGVTVLGSSVFVTAHFLGVTKGYTSEAEAVTGSA